MLAIYCRTSSSKEEGKDYSIPVQKEEGVKFALANGYDEYEFYVDAGVSGTLSFEDRPDFGRLFEDIRNKKITAIYCYDQSRIERDIGVWSVFHTECVLQECRFFPEGKESDLKDPTTILNANILSSINSYYAQMTSKKVKQANLKKAKDGKTHGLKPYGYTKDEENKYKIDEDEAKIVKLIFKMSLEGKGAYQIADILNEKKVKTRMNGFEGVTRIKDKYTGKITEFNNKDIKWRGNTVHGILTNRIYKGEKLWNGDVVFRFKETIIDAEMWDKVNKNLAKNKKEKSGRRPKYNYLLNGITTCSHCGEKYVGKRNVKINDNTYKCKGRREKRTCNEGMGISLIRLENGIIRHLFYNAALKELLINAPRNKSRLQELKSLLTQKEREHVASQTLKKNSLTKMVKFPDDEDLEALYSDAKKAVEKSELEIEKLKQEISSIENETQKVVAQSAFDTYTKDIGFDDLKRLVHQIIENIEIKSCTSYIEERDAYVPTFQIFITYKNNKFVSRLFTDRFANHWVWRIEGHNPKDSVKDEVEDTKKRLEEEEVFYEEFNPVVDGKEYKLGTLAKFTLPPKKDLLQYN